MMITIKVCPSCKHENHEAAAYCTKCGKLLVAANWGGIDTRPVPEDEILKIAAEARPPQVVITPDEDAMLALFVFGQEQPILLNNDAEIILGRFSEGDELPPIIDQALALHAGVSRYHATINYADGVYTIKDLGSTNGTFLNSKPLLAQIPYILQSGDQIRLGALVLYIYFKQ